MLQLTSLICPNFGDGLPERRTAPFLGKGSPQPHLAVLQAHKIAGVARCFPPGLPWDGQAGEHLGIIGNRDLSAGSWARQEPFAASTQSPTSEPAQSGSG